jgi:hypothetical protein
MFQLDHDKRSATLGSRWSAVWTHTRNLRVRRRRVVTTHGAGGTTTPGTTGDGRLGPLRILLGQSISAQCGSTERLADRSPLYRDRAGGRTYAAIFAPDPSPAPDEMKPLAVITLAGYVGSAWGALATEFAPRVLRGFRPDAQGGRLVYATVVRLRPDPSPGLPDFQAVEVWVPRPEPLPAASP